MILSWAAKRGWKPTFVDLDIGQGAIKIPGCISASPIEMPIDPVEVIPLIWPSFSILAMQLPDISMNTWLLRCYSLNTELYKVLVKELAQTIERQFAGNAESRAAGMVINTMGWIEGPGYELLLDAINTFNADVILVIGHDKTCSRLKDVLKTKPNVNVVKLQKSGGVVSRNHKVQTKSQKLQNKGSVLIYFDFGVLQEYFYGLSNELSPYSNVANFSDFFVYKIGGGPAAPRSALPIGAEPTADPKRAVLVNINRDWLHSVLAVSFAKEPDQIISRKKITYLAPSQGELPSKYLIAGTLTWLET
ncbi:hypothetical protein GIB67_007124 [Kingdonia uniflora]|uniref:Uncharacterized protein n=1 Tax=Kingdonia uniflora TaxID=39325 RepID=A0A7J7MLH0_9MAGN|nr:hypothetical protein GIB67_007124 [Kingdonia uniflora]